MGHIRVPQTVRVQRGVEAEVVAVLGEPHPDVAARDPGLSFGRPQHPGACRVEQRQHVGDVFLDHWAGPVEHRQHRPPTGRGAFAGLAPADVADPVPAELGRGRVAGEVMQVQHPDLAAAQPEGVDHLEQGRVAEHRLPALLSARASMVGAIVGVVEEGLYLFPRQWPDRRACLVIAGVDRGVPLMADLHRMSAEQFLASLDPAVAAVGQVVAEQRDRVLIRADRAVRARLVAGDQLGRPLLDIGGRPLPRQAPAEHGEPAHLRQARPDRLGVQHP